jgi:SAM-dependent methyltransferase
MPAEEVAGHIEANCQLDIPWLAQVEPHDGVAIICGGGPSLEDTTDAIGRLQAKGGTIFGLNGASVWLSVRGYHVDYQVIIDAKQETSCLVDHDAEQRVFCSVVHPDTARYADMIFHLDKDGTEDLLPPERVEAGGYALVGGGVSVGITTLCLAYMMGFRTLHLFGYDSSDRAGFTHAYPQRMNEFIPKIDIRWAGEMYRCSMPMKLQAEAFHNFARKLKDAGCEVSVYGTGLLPAMWHQPPMTEREKYQLLWADDRYRVLAPGEDIVQTFLDVAKPEGSVIDFGCGTGRAALKIREVTGAVTLMDFVDNCRDESVAHLPFVHHDLTQPVPHGISAPYGYCTDMMEHIPTTDVPKVIDNIMAAAARVFFQISTVPDGFGSSIGQVLHVTVKPHSWWRERFSEYRIDWQEEGEISSCFFVSNDKAKA